MNDNYSNLDTTMDYTYNTSSTLSPEAGAAMAGASLVFMLLYLAVIVVMVASLWKLFTKAGKPGWASIVPIYNNIVLLEIIGRPWWWLLIIMLVPFLGLWVAIVVMLDTAKAYGKSTGYGILLALVPVIGFPMLAFSKNANYVGPVAQGLEGFGPAPERVAHAPVEQSASTQ